MQQNWLSAVGVFMILNLTFFLLVFSLTCTLTKLVEIFKQLRILLQDLFFALFTGIISTFAVGAVEMIRLRTSLVSFQSILRVVCMVVKSMSTSCSTL